MRRRGRGGGGGEGVVVGGEEVVAFEQRLDPLAGGQVDLLLDEAALGQVDGFGVDGAAVDVEPQRLGGFRAAGVAQGDEGAQAAAPGFDHEPGDGPVGGPVTDLLVARCRAGSASARRS